MTEKKHRATSHKGTNAGKDVIYIDVDDEITAIIEKVHDSQQKIVALVLPKRATVLQSIVNMKLLKRSADSGKKNLVLITSEAGLLPLAGTVGIHVAHTLQSKPEIPDAPEKAEEKPEEVEAADADDDTDAETDVDKTKTVGELAGAAIMSEEAEDTIELDDEDEDPGDSPVSKLAGKLKGKNKKFKIPNFNKFRTMLVLGGLGLIVLIVGLVMAMRVLPKATVTIKTDSSAVSSSVNLVLKNAPEAVLDVPTGSIPSTVQQTQKVQTQQVPATGKQNNGEKATGSVAMTGKDCSPPYKAPDAVDAGTGVSSGGNTYITQGKATFSLSSASDCVYYSTNSVGIVAQTGGTKYNIGTSNFTVAGRSDVSASGSASGGTDDISTVVTQADIDSAKQKIGGLDVNPIHQDLKDSLQTKGLLAIDTTFKASEADTKLSANVGDKTDVVTVTQTINYTMLGVKQSDLQKLIAADVNTKINPKKQKILDYGLGDAQFAVQSQDANGAAATVQTTVIAGPELDVATIKQQVAGKKAGDAIELIKAYPGVTNVDVNYSPFFVTSIPKNTTKITVTIVKPTLKADANATP